MKISSSLILLIVANSLYSQNKDNRFLDFKNTLSPQMGYDSIISRYGQPDNITGSGISILIYNLNDSSNVIIGCTRKQIFYTKVSYSNGIVVGLFPKYSITNHNWRPKIIASVSYEINRECDTLIIPSIKDIKRGIYTFIIYVNNEGQVQKTYLNHHVSPNIPNDQTREILIKSINNIKFSKNTFAPEEEIGSITYTFKKEPKQRK